MEAAEAAEKYNLPRRTVERIRVNLGPKLAEVGAKKLDRIGDLLADLIEANVAGMKAIATLPTNERYLKEHGPSAVSDLYQQLANTTVRLLEAAGAVNEADSPEPV
jgi:phosphoglycolate phosphatase-like HAD superfamily hydrolase